MKSDRRQISFKSVMALLTILMGALLYGRIRPIYAACTGTVTCCNAVDTTVGPPGCQSDCGTPPVPNCVECTTTQTCSDTSMEGCYTSGGACGHNACNYYVISGACQYSPPADVCPSGMNFCGGCVNACRNTAQKTCSQIIAEECSGQGGGGGGGGSCNANWCTSASHCASVGGTSGSGAGYCSNPNDVRCCVGNPPPPDPPAPFGCTINIGYGGGYGAGLDLPSALTVGQSDDAYVETHDLNGALHRVTGLNPRSWQFDYQSNYPEWQIYSSNPNVLSVARGVIGVPQTQAELPYWHGVFGPTILVTANAPGTADITVIALAKKCPACAVQRACGVTKTVTVQAACTPTCTGNLCGQSDGCGGTCPNTAAGIPTAPTNLSPANGTTVTLTGTTITLSWTNTSSLTDSYSIEVYPQGTSCAHANAYCGTVIGTSYAYNVTSLPGTHLQWRVSAVNASCGSQPGTFSAWQVVGVLGTITGSFRTDPNNTAVISGGVCINGSGGATSLGAGSSLSVVGKNSSNWGANVSGSTFSVSPWYWNPGGNNTLTLHPGIAPNGEPYACTCPAGCQYGGINSPRANVTFFLQQNDLINNGWWQVRGGNVYAAQTNSVALRSSVPTFYCSLPMCIPYILGRDLADKPDSAGIAVTGGGVADSTKAPGNQGTNVTQRGTQTVSTGTVVTKVRENYDYFAREMSLGLTPTNDFSGQENDARKPISAPSGGKSAYYHNGNLTIQSPWQVTNGEKITVFVDGNLTITDPTGAGQLIRVEEGGFLAFIVKGDITIDPNVGNNNDLASLMPNIEGVYIADGTVALPSRGAAAGGDERFIGAGTFVGWTNVVLQRDFDDGGTRKIENNTKAAAVFLFRPDFTLSLPEQMTRSSYIWQETN